MKSKKIKLFVVSDNASNIQAALGKLPQCQSFGCFNHTLQLVINDAVKSCRDLDETITTAKKIATFFKHSGPNSKKLKDIEKLNLKVKPEYPTRWICFKDW